MDELLKESKEELKVILTFIHETKDGKYARIDDQFSILSRMTISRDDFNPEPQFYLGIR